MKKFKVSEPAEITNSNFFNTCPVCSKEISMGLQYVMLRVEEDGERAAYTNRQAPHLYFCNSELCVNFYIMSNM
jgi:hypothetical protein